MTRDITHSQVALVREILCARRTGKQLNCFVLNSPMCLRNIKTDKSNKITDSQIALGHEILFAYWTGKPLPLSCVFSLLMCLRFVNKFADVGKQHKVCTDIHLPSVGGAGSVSVQVHCFPKVAHKLSVPMPATSQRMSAMCLHTVW